MEMIKPMIVGSESTAKKIFKEKPHSTWDNYFSGDQIMEWLGQQGFGCTMMARRDRLPEKIPEQYLLKKKI